MIVGFITGSGLLARTIDWKELGHLLEGQTMSADEVAKVNESVNQKLARRRVNRGRQNEGDASLPNQPTETNLPLPTPTVDIVTAQAAAIPGTATEREVVMARHNSASRAEVAPDVEIQQIEAAPTDQTGIVSINCPVPARVYIDGQYSGVTPRTVHLNAGEHQVRLVADGYLEWNSKVRVRSRQQMGVLASMTRAE
ncbi:MAG: PEGA domain-containing protein [Acidobacteriota bacterium]